MTGSTSFSGIFFAACFVCVLAGLGGDYCGCSSSSSSSYIVLRWNGLTSFLTGGFAEAVDFVWLGDFLGTPFFKSSLKGAV